MPTETLPASRARRRARIRRRIRRAFLGSSIFFLCWALVMLFTGDRFLLGRVGLYVAPWLMLLTGALAALAAWQKALRAAAGLGAVCAGLAWVQWPEAREAPPHTVLSASEISIMTVSNRIGARDMAPVAAFLQANPADVFALQGIADPPGLLARLPGLSYCRDGVNLIVSRFALGRPEPESTESQLFCRAETPLGRILIGSISLPGPRRDMAVRAHGLARLLAAIETARLPILLAGGFNTVPLAEPYRRIRGHLEDAHAAAGRGWGMTFPTRARSALGAFGPLLRLDYVFHGPGLVTSKAQVLHSHPPGADHWPVRAVLRPMDS